MSRAHAARLHVVPAPGARTVGRVAALVDPAATPTRRPLVVRERLIRVVAGNDAPLQVIVAPAGYGKTTMLRQWAERDPRAFAWVTIRRGHEDPVRLLTDIVEALDTIEPVDDAVMTALRTPHPAISTVVVPRLEQALAARTQPFVLVVDEAEILSQQGAFDVLGTLSGLLPYGSALAVAARCEPALPLGRLRAHAQVVEVRTADLAMTRGEARDMLAAEGLDLAADQIDALVEQTEGWPAGLYLAALALREQDDLDTAIAHFAGDDRLVADYLHDELLCRLAPADRALLMRCSPLDELSGPLCDAVTGTSGSGAVLRRLARSNLLLSPLDRCDERFRCHTLLADALRAELRRVEPETEAEVHRRASDWCDEHDDVEGAIEHAIAAGDASRAGRLIWRVVPVYGAYGRHATVKRWLEHFTDDRIAHQPELALAAATTHMISGERDAVERWALLAGARLDRAADEARDDLEAGVAIMRATVARGGIAQMRDDAARADAQLAEDSPWRSLSCLLMGTAHVVGGDQSEGCERLEQGSRRGATSAPGVQVLCLGLLALVALMREEWEEGGRIADLARAQVERVGLGEYATCALVFAVSAFARAQRGRPDAARRDVDDAHRLLPRLDDFTPVFAALTTLALARAQLRLGDAPAARALLVESARHAAGAPTLQMWIDDAGHRTRSFVQDATACSSSLTAAELRVLSFLPSHGSLREIAAALGVSTNTVKTQAHALYRKLDVSSRSQAVARAAQLGLV